MAMVGAAAAAKNVDLRVGPNDAAILVPELDRVAGVAIGRVVQFMVTATGRVRAQTPQALCPGLLRVDCAFEEGGMAQLSR